MLQPKVVEMMQSLLDSHIPHHTTTSLIEIPTGIARRRTDERTGQTGPLVTCRWARHSMPTRLSGRAGRGIHHGQKRKLHQRAEYIAADHFSSSELFACNQAADHTLPNGCAVATHSLGDWTGSSEGDPNSFWGRSPHLSEAPSGSREGERASEGRGCSERGTLNADRQANRKGANLFKSRSHGVSCRHNSSASRAVLTSIGRAARMIARPNSYRSAHLLALSIVLRM